MQMIHPENFLEISNLEKPKEDFSCNNFQHIKRLPFGLDKSNFFFSKQKKSLNWKGKFIVVKYSIVE